MRLPPSILAVTEQRVRVEHRGPVAVVTLSRPERHNALDAAMFEAIVGAAGEIGATPGVRAVVLHGEGPSFCSGLDLASFASGPLSPEDLLAREDGHRSTLAQRTCTDWIDLPVPDVAKELTYTGRVASGSEAAVIGLVTRVADDPLAAALELGDEIAARSPDAIRAAKRLYDAAWQATVEEGLMLESELQSRLMGSPNQIEAVRAGMAREAASFADPEPAAAASRPGVR